MIESRLLEALTTEETSERRFAAQEIGESGDPEALSVLIAQLHREESRAVKDAILRAISKSWSGEDVDSVIELLKDDDPFVRAEASDMLQRRVEDALDGLGRLMLGGDRDLRKFCIDILSQTSTPVPDSIYLAALKDEDINVVICALESIGAGRRASLAEPVLAIALETKPPMALCAGLETLALIGSSHTLDALRARFPDASSVNGLYLQPFIKLLGGVAGPEAVAEICRVIEKDGSWVYSVSIDALHRIAARNQLSRLDPEHEELLCRLLQEPLDKQARFHLVRLLGHFTHSTKVAHALLPYIRDSDRTLAMAAAESLIHSPDPAVDEGLRAMLETEDDPDLREELEDLLGRRP